MAGCAQRDSVPAKIELEDSNGTRIPPEQVDISLLGNLPNAERGALFALSQWCNGKLSSFLQLDLSQTNELVKILDGIPCFYAANQPEEEIGWSDGNLVGVSEYLPQKRLKKIKKIKRFLLMSLIMSVRPSKWKARPITFALYFLQPNTLDIEKYLVYFANGISLGIVHTVTGGGYATLLRFWIS